VVSRWLEVAFEVRLVFVDVIGGNGLGTIIRTF